MAGGGFLWLRVVKGCLERGRMDRIATHDALKGILSILDFFIEVL